MTRDEPKRVTSPRPQGRCLSVPEEPRGRFPVSWVYAVVWGFVVLLGVSAVWGLAWAVRSGQMEDFTAGARSIFDEEEPVGTPTDAWVAGGRQNARRPPPTR
jgi:nitrogen fixation-related uncharacterized protein